ncbi:MAG: hypothetical protein WC069_06790 [Candidatus Shapirobacteria bacterium]
MAQTKIDNLVGLTASQISDAGAAFPAFAQAETAQNQADLLPVATAAQGALADTAVQPGKYAYVETTGNDSTAVVGDQGRPFATINAAVVALASGGTIQLGVGSFAGPTVNTLVDHLRIIGSGEPMPNSATPTGFVAGSGTIITSPGIHHSGALDGLVIRDLGVFVEGNCISFGGPVDSLQNMLIENVTVISSKGSSSAHGISLEDIYLSEFRNLTVYYANHGIAIKTRYCTFSDLRLGGAAEDSIIFKSNNTAAGFCEHNNVTNVTLFPVSDQPTYGIVFNNLSTTNPVQSVNITNVVGVGVTNGIIFNTTVDGTTDIKISNVSFLNGFGSGLSSGGAGELGDVTITDMTVSGNTTSSYAFAFGSTQRLYSAFTVVRPRAIGNSGDGFIFSTTATGLYLINPEASNNGGYGFKLYQTGDIAISGQWKNNNNTSGPFAVRGGGGWITQSPLQFGKILMNFAGTLKTQTTAVGNVGTGSDTLMTVSIPANTLRGVGTTIQIVSSGTFGATDNTKQLRAYFGTEFNATYSVAFDSTAQAQNGGAWTMTSIITWVSSTLVKISTQFQSPNASHATTSYYEFTSTVNYDRAMRYYLKADATDNNDITQQTSIATWMQASP